MRRRDLLAAICAAASWPLSARAQQAGKVARIGYLGFGTALAWAPRVDSMPAGLRDLGYVEGKNIVIEFRWGGHGCPTARNGR
jgi:putative tryptophan/tyrosine transport system substrate-binding protein